MEENAKKDVSIYFIFLFGIFVIASFAWYSKDLPDPYKIMDRSVALSTKIYDRTGETLLYEVHGPEKRTLVDIDELPESFGNLNADTVLLSNNNIPELPSGMFDKYFDFLWVENNNLQFGSLEPFMDNGIWEFIYDPQAQIGNDTTIEVINNGILSYTIEVSGDNNVYQWYKDGTLLFDQTSNTLYVENASIDDQGTYMLKVTNTLVPVLELSSYDVEVSIITGISETQEAILALFPNPASGNEIMLISENSEEIIEVTIMSLSGQVLITESTIKSSGKLDISELNKGMYLVQVILQDSQTIIKKLIVD